MARALKPPAVYAIADLGVLGARELPAAVAEMAESGVAWIQLRAKRATGALLYDLTAECLRRLEGSSAALWLDDRADVAALLPVAGVHVGQEDLPPAAVRRTVGPDCWIGVSTHDDAQLAAAAADPDVDVVAFGPIFPTRSKEQPDPVVGLAGLARARRATAKPLVAVGGVEAASLAQVFRAGADTAAVLGAVCHGDVRANCQRLLKAAEEVR